MSRIEERFATARTLVFTPDGSKLLIGDKNLYVADFEELLKKN